MSEVTLQSAKELFATLEKRIILLQPSADRQDAERLRDNLAACISLGETSPGAVKILLPNVIESAEAYLRSVRD